MEYFLTAIDMFNSRNSKKSNTELAITSIMLMFDEHQQTIQLSLYIISILAILFIVTIILLLCCCATKYYFESISNLYYFIKNLFVAFCVIFTISIKSYSFFYQSVTPQSRQTIFQFISSLFPS